MKYHRVKLIGSASELEKVIEVIETSLCDGWTRDKDREEANSKKINSKLFCFVSRKTNSRPGVSLSLRFGQDQSLGVNNIVPLEKGQLLTENYNSILEEFLTKFIKPATKDLDIEIVTTPRDLLKYFNSK